MATTKLKSKLDLEIKVSLEMTLAEARALDDIVKYGSKPFLDWFKKNLGKYYIEKQEKGLISLFDTIGTDLRSKIHEADRIIKAIDNELNPIK